MRGILILLCCLLLSCKLKIQSDSTANAERVEAEVRTTLNNYYEDIRKEGLIAEFKYLDASDSFFWVPPGYAVPLSFDTIKAIISRNAAACKLVSNTWDTLRIVPLSDALASYTGILKSEMTLQNDSIIHTRLIETGVLIKRNDGWKLLNGQSAVIQP